METIQDKQIKIKVASWPCPQDYNEAVQNLEHSMLDPDLRGGTAELNELGLPKPYSGSFASVYKISTGSNDWALRCFLHNRPDQYERYKILHAHLGSIEPLDCLVSFSYLDDGIKVHGRTLPVLKMSWASGVQLIEYIEANLKSAEHLAALRDEFRTQMQMFESCGIAHGDLQHGNILVQDDKVHFVDYDGMYVSALESLGSLELGHRNFQHPRRNRDHFGPWLDNFPAWIIYCSLTCVMYDPNLWKELNAGDECLLFRNDDFVNPLESKAFYILEHHRYEQVRLAAKYLRSLLDCELAEIPYLDELPVYVRDLPEVRRQVLPVATPAFTELDVRVPIAKTEWPLSASSKSGFALAGRPLSFFVLLVSGFSLALGVSVYLTLYELFKSPWENAYTQCGRSATAIMCLLGTSTKLTNKANYAVYVKRAEPYFSNKAITAEGVQIIGLASLELLEPPFRSPWSLSEFNNKVHKLLSSPETKKSLAPYDLDKLQSIYDANSKAVDALIRTAY